MSIITPSVTPLLSDIVTYVRRIIKQPNQEDISDSTIGDYVNRFYIFDVPARIQLFDLKTQYTVDLIPNVDQYNAPITYLPSGTVIPTYNSFLTPAFIDGYQIVMQQSTQQWYKLFPNRFENNFQQNGNGTSGPYTFSIANSPIIQGHRDQNIQPATNLGLLTSNVYITAMNASGNQLVVQDDPVNSTTGNLIGGGTGSINYLTGLVSNLVFNSAIPTTNAINYQAIPYSAGRPQAVLFFNNVFCFRPVPSMPFLFQIDAYYNPAAFLATTNAVPYRWMAEYFARGTARKILQDYGDAEQLAFYEPYFREQENFVLRRTTRQNSNVRTSTIYQGQTSYAPGNYNGI